MTVPVLALGRGVLDVEEDNISIAKTGATSLVTERFRRSRVGEIRTWVRYVHLPLSTLIERTVRTAVRRLLTLLARGRRDRCARYSIFRISAIRYRMRRHHFTPSLRCPPPRNSNATAHLATSRARRSGIAGLRGLASRAII
jgi:hypothetical protein